MSTPQLFVAVHASGLVQAILYAEGRTTYKYVRIPDNKIDGVTVENTVADSITAAIDFFKAPSKLTVRLLGINVVSIRERMISQAAFPLLATMRRIAASKRVVLRFEVGTLDHMSKFTELMSLDEPAEVV